MPVRFATLPAAVTAIALVAPSVQADTETARHGVYAFGPDQTIADVGKLDWAPLQLDGHTSDELYVWLQGQFTYIAADGRQQALAAPAYISLPGDTPHALRCGENPCIFYLRYGRPFDLHVHPMPAGVAAK